MAVKALLNFLYDNVTQSPSENKIGLEDCSVQASMIANISKISHVPLRGPLWKKSPRDEHIGCFIESEEEE